MFSILAQLYLLNTLSVNKVVSNDVSNNINIRVVLDILLVRWI